MLALRSSARSEEVCGIFGYVSKNNIKAVPIVLDGLKRLEYRGYDSSGIAALVSSGIVSRKKSGRTVGK